ncbi:hypothetical protein K1719_024211 [Acacia pycnantha]|nr:hypothetical protein K1719_024211 [Acacia pycnantha]
MHKVGDNGNGENRIEGAITCDEPMGISTDVWKVDTWVLSNVSGSRRKKGGVKKRTGTIQREVGESSEKGIGRQALRKEKRMRDVIVLVERKPDLLRLTYLEPKIMKMMLEDRDVGVGNSELDGKGALLDPLMVVDFQPTMLDPGKQDKLAGLPGRFWADPTEVAQVPLSMEDSPSAQPLDSMVFFWNACGACSSSLIRNLWFAWGGTFPDLLVLAETKSEKLYQFNSLSKVGFDGLAVIPSVGRSGGLVAAWRSNNIGVTVVCTNQQYFHLRISTMDRRLVFLTAVYAIPSASFKQALWDDLLSMAGEMSSPWLVVGDFNDIMAASERAGGAGVCYLRVGNFQRRIQTYQL